MFIPNLKIRQPSTLILMALLLSMPSLFYAQESGAVRLLAHYIPPSGGGYTSGCWGWTDSTTGREYALLGNQCGTAIVEITNPSAPIERDFIPGVCSSWRELQVHSHYVYVVSEGGGGTQIIDLSYLPDSVHLVRGFIYSDGLGNTSRSHTITIRDGYMYLNGGSYRSGGIAIFSLADPVNPAFVSSYETRYVHDSFVRHDTIYAATINAGGIDVIDVTVKTSPQFLYRFTYPGAGTHNCATTVDGRFLLTTDEVGSTPKTLKVWDVRNPPTIPQVAEYVGDPTSIVHNVFVKDSLAFMSYYTAGLKVVDVADPANPIEIGGYDTYPGPGGGYTGAWSTYPFFPSGRVIIGDMVTGMYVVDLDVNAPHAPAGFAAYSDYTTPTSVHLTWTDPTTLISGEPLTNFDVHVYRDGALVAVVDSGVQQYTDSGLDTHQFYAYSISAVIASDSSSRTNDSVYAGGHAVPEPVSQFTVDDGPDAIHLTWRNPSRQLDGTPLNDLAYVLIYRDGAILDSMVQTFTDTGQVRTYVDSVLSYHRYQIRVRDNENPVHFSTFSDSLLGHGGFLASYDQGFESGRGAVYVTGQWDTTRTLAHNGLASLTDSPSGNYSNSTTSIFLLPPVVVGPSIEVSFSHIAIVAVGDIAYAEISNDHNRTYMTLRAFNWNLHPEWQDGNADPGDWFTETFSLASYAGDTVAVRFRLVTNASITADGWYVDDIHVGPATAVRDPRKENHASFALEQNYPNPFNPSTVIRYSLSVAGRVTLKVYDILGVEIATLVQGEQPAGWHSAAWNGTNSHGAPVGSGLYIYRLEATSPGAAGFVRQQKMLLVK